MSRPIPLDTDVPIDFLHGHDKAVSFVNVNLDRIILSSIVAELYAGVRSGNDGPDYEQISACDIGSMETRAQSPGKPVIPAKPGIYFDPKFLDSRFRGNDRLKNPASVTMAGHPLGLAEVQHFTDTARRMATIEYQEPSKRVDTGELKP